MADIIIVHGTPGAGKGTLSKDICLTPRCGRNIFHISAGDRLRDINTGLEPSKLADKVKSELASGDLSNITLNDIVFEKIDSCPDDSIVILDGYPTRLDAVPLFLETVNGSRHKLLGGIMLEVSQETSFLRLAGRGLRGGEKVPAITPAHVEARYRTFKNMTEPTMAVLEGDMPVLRINAEPNKDVVRQRFEEAFDHVAGIKLEC